MKSITMPTKKSSATMNNRNNIMRKVRQNKKSSARQKLENRMKSRLRMLIGLMNSASDIGHQRKRNSANWTMVL